MREDGAGQDGLLGRSRGGDAADGADSGIDVFNRSEFEPGVGKDGSCAEEGLPNEGGHDECGGGAGSWLRSDEEIDAGAGDALGVGLRALGKDGAGGCGSSGKVGELAELESCLVELQDGEAVGVTGEGGDVGGLWAEALCDAHVPAGANVGSGRWRLVEYAAGRDGWGVEVVGYADVEMEGGGGGVRLRQCFAFEVWDGDLGAVDDEFHGEDSGSERDAGEQEEQAERAKERGHARSPTIWTE